MSLHLGFIWPSFPNQWNSSGTRNPKASFSSLSCREQGFQEQGCSKTFMGAFSAFLFSVTPSSTENDKNYSLWLLSYKWSESFSVVSDSLWPHRLYSPWSFPSQNTGVGSHSLLQGIFSIQGSNLGLLHCRQILYQQTHQGSLHDHRQVKFSSCQALLGSKTTCFKKMKARLKS